MPRASFWLAASDSVRAALHGSGRALYPRAEELPTPAGLFEHRPQRDYVAGTGLRRASGYPGHAAAHDFSFSDQTLAVLLRRKCPATSEHGPVPEGERGIDPFHAIDRRRISHGDSRGHGITSLQLFPE